MECHSKSNFTQIGTLLKFECHPNWNVTLIGMSIKLKCHSSWNVTQIKCQNVNKSGMCLHWYRPVSDNEKLQISTEKNKKTKQKTV